MESPKDLIKIIKRYQHCIQEIDPLENDSKRVSMQSIVSIYFSCFVSLIVFTFLPTISNHLNVCCLFIRSANLFSFFIVCEKNIDRMFCTPKINKRPRYV